MLWSYRVCILFVSALLTACIREQPVPSLEWQPLFLQHYDYETIEQVDLSADGNWLLASSNHTLRLWGITRPDKPLTHRFPAPSIVVESAFLGDTTELLLANQNGQVQLWDRQLREKIFEYNFPEGAKYARADAEGRYFAYGEYVYDRQGARILGEPAYHASQSALSMSSELVLTAGFHDCALILRDLTNGKMIRWWALRKLSEAAISADGKSMIAGGDGYSYLWNAPDQDPVEQWYIPGRVRFMRFASNNEWFVVVTDAGFAIYQLNPFARRAWVAMCNVLHSYRHTLLKNPTI